MQNTHDLLVGTLSIGIPSLKIYSIKQNQFIANSPVFMPSFHFFFLVFRLNTVYINSVIIVDRE